MMHLCLILTWEILTQFHILPHTWEIQKVLITQVLLALMELLILVAPTALKVSQALMILKVFHTLKAH
jgi:hypothetical protein